MWPVMRSPSSLGLTGSSTGADLHEAQMSATYYVSLTAGASDTPHTAIQIVRWRHDYLCEPQHHGDSHAVAGISRASEAAKGISFLPVRWLRVT